MSSTSTTSSTSILDQVSSLVATGTSALSDTVAKQLAQLELDKRTGALQRAVTQQQANRAALAKLDEDVKTYNEDGTVKDAAFSQGRLNQRKSTQERIDKLEESISKAVNDKNWTDLLEVTGYNY